MVTITFWEHCRRTAVEAAAGDDRRPPTRLVSGPQPLLGYVVDAAAHTGALADAAHDFRDDFRG